MFKYFILMQCLFNAIALSQSPQNFVGVDLIVSNLSGSQTLTIYGQDHKNSIGSTANSGIGFFIGSRIKTSTNHYLGIECYLNYISNKINIQSNLATNYTIKNSGSSGIKLKLGYYVDRAFVIYIGSGPQYSTWKIKYKDKVNDWSRIEKNHYKLYFAHFLGGQWYINDQWFIRGEYHYIKSPSAINGKRPNTHTTSSTYYKNNNDLDTSHEVTVSQNCFNLGIGFIF